VPDSAIDIRRPPALERGDGVSEIAIARRGAASALVHLYQRSPCRVLLPRPAPGDPLTAVLLTTSGGLAGGDRLRIGVRVGAEAAALVTAQAAEKIYRSTGADCEVGIDLTVEPGGWLEFLPQETILFDGARLVRRTAARVATGGRLLAADMVVFGRIARGERFRRGLWHDGWRLRCGPRLAWVDALRLDGDIGQRLAAGPGFDGAAAMATAIYAGDDAARWLERARDLAAAAVCRAAATVVNGVLLARFIGREAATVRQALTTYLGTLRQCVAGLPPRLPRVWDS
jgi:urease accessory protein